jgi:hypothetical protein
MVVLLDPDSSGAELDVRTRTDGGIWFQGNLEQLTGSLRRLERLGVTHVALDPTTVAERGTPLGRARAQEMIAQEVFAKFK